MGQFRQKSSESQESRTASWQSRNDTDE